MTRPAGRMSPRINRPVWPVELACLADAHEFCELAAYLAPAGHTLPAPDRLYRGLGLDEAAVEKLLSTVAAGGGVPSLEDYDAEKLSDLALAESLAGGAAGVAELFAELRPEVATALERLESVLGDLRDLLRAEVGRQHQQAPDVEQRLFERVAKPYVLGEIPPYLQSAALGRPDGAGAGCALFFAIEKGAKQGKIPVVVEFDRPESGVVDVGVYPSGLHEFVILGAIPGPAVRAVWVNGRRLEREECIDLARGQAHRTASGSPDGGPLISIKGNQNE